MGTPSPSDGARPAPAHTDVRHVSQRIGRGILFMCAAVTLFAMMNALVKLLSSGYDPVQIVWARILGHLVFIMALFMPRHSFGILRSKRYDIQFSRSIAQVCSTMLFFSAIKHVPLAEATSISFLAPVFVTLLAIPMLGERVTPSRTFAVFAGFVGVLIVMRPGSEVFRWASLLILGSALCYAIYQVLTRRVAQADSPETSAVYSALLGTVLATLAVPLFWTTPERIFDVLVLSSLGILGGLGHYFVARAMLNAPANIVSPFQYFQLIGAVVLGYLLFGDLPTVYTWIGAAIIVGSGLFMGWNESRRRAEPAIR